MKILITGGNGDVGIAISKRLIQHGHSVLAYDLKGGRLPGAVHYIEGDVRDFPRLAAAASGCDAGIHLAVLAGDSSAADIMSVNVLGAYGFLLAAQKARFRCAAVASSAPVHLEPSPRDGGPLLPTSADSDHVYDLTKALQEVIGRDFHAHGLPVFCLRFGHIVLGAEETNLEGTRSLENEDYCRGGWVALEDVANACAAAVALRPSDQVFEVLNLVGAVTARARFRVASAEQRLGVKLHYDFAAYQ